MLDVFFDLGVSSESGGVDKDHGAHPGQLEGFVHRIGGGPGHRGDQGDGLAGEGVDEGGLPGVAVAEKPDMEPAGPGGVLDAHGGSLPFRVLVN